MPSAAPSAKDRLQAFTLQLQSSQKPSTMSAQTKDPITCHVLDTTTGRPAANIHVKLVCCSIPDIVFECHTDGDGRITNWKNRQGANGEEGTYVTANRGVFETMKLMINQHAASQESLSCPIGSSLWKLHFHTGDYYGTTNTFFPVVELTFLVKEGEHFHVPLLLGPYSFTTYRGS